ncbi:hypothetical protein Dimus_033811 [Dionaea muscipula]
MAGMCCGIVGESEPSPVPSASRSTRRRRMNVRRLRVVPDASVEFPVSEFKRQKLDLQDPSPAAAARECLNAVDSCTTPETPEKESGVSPSNRSSDPCSLTVEAACSGGSVTAGAKFGVTSVRGRRRDMEDAVSVHASFCGVHEENNPRGFDFYGVFDGHGCSHVAMKCKERMHEIVKEEIERERVGSTDQWKEAMERSFSRMDKEVVETAAGVVSCCRCELRTPQCDAVGSTAVVAVITPDKIVVPNCGDSRAVLCRNGAAIPLSSDHKVLIMSFELKAKKSKLLKLVVMEDTKNSICVTLISVRMFVQPDRPDELERIQAAGGRVIYWYGARVSGVLAMSRAIGDNYFKPYVLPEPEVTVTERAEDDECLILASDGLWDVVSNETACSVARMCLSARSPPPSPPPLPESKATATATATMGDAAGTCSDQACSDASILLTKLALARNSADNVSVVVVDLKR